MVRDGYADCSLPTVSSAQAEREEKVEKPQEASPEQAETEKIRKQ